jgi:hypothetical protein
MLPLLRVVLATRTSYTLTPPSAATLIDLQAATPAIAGITFNENGTWSTIGNDSAPASGSWIVPNSAATSRNFYLKYNISNIFTGGSFNLQDDCGGDDTYAIINGSGGIVLKARDAISTAAGSQIWDVDFTVALDGSGAGAVASSVTNNVDVDYEV